MKRILLIEDDKDLNKGLVYDLEMHDYRVYPAFLYRKECYIWKKIKWIRVCWMELFRLEMDLMFAGR